MGLWKEINLGPDGWIVRAVSVDADDWGTADVESEIQRDRSIPVKSFTNNFELTIGVDSLFVFLPTVIKSKKEHTFWRCCHRNITLSP